MHKHLTVNGITKQVIDLKTSMFCFFFILVESLMMTTMTVLFELYNEKCKKGGHTNFYYIKIFLKFAFHLHFTIPNYNVNF